MPEILGEREKTILIASCNLDEPLIRPVAETLTAWGYAVTTYEADKVASGDTPLSIQISDAGLTVVYDRKPLPLASIASAWYRRPNIFGPIQEDKAKQLSIDKERRELQDAMWSVVPENAWLNAPERIQRGANKLTQLVLARSVGFVTPDTVVSNQWEDISRLPSEKVAIKMPYGILHENNKTRVLYTTVLDNTGMLPSSDNPFPGIWQPYIPKGREWRITVVGDKTFDVAIYTGVGAKDDWRRHQDGPEVTFRQESFPDTPKEQCLRFLGQLGLRYGAFDFIEDPDGRVIFLEANLNGQYGWLEYQLGIPISEAIAHELMAIAEAA